MSSRLAGQGIFPSKTKAGPGKKTKTGSTKVPKGRGRSPPPSKAGKRRSKKTRADYSNIKARVNTRLEPKPLLSRLRDADKKSRQHSLHYSGKAKGSGMAMMKAKHAFFASPGRRYSKTFLGGDIVTPVHSFAKPPRRRLMKRMPFNDDSQVQLSSKGSEIIAEWEELKKNSAVEQFNQYRKQKQLEEMNGRPKAMTASHVPSLRELRAQKLAGLRGASKPRPGMGNISEKKEEETVLSPKSNLRALRKQKLEAMKRDRYKPRTLDDTDGHVLEAVVNKKEMLHALEEIEMERAARFREYYGDKMMTLRPKKNPLLAMAMKQTTSPNSSAANSPSISAKKEPSASFSHMSVSLSTSESRRHRRSATLDGHMTLREIRMKKVQATRDILLQTRPLLQKSSSLLASTGSFEPKQLKNVAQDLSATLPTAIKFGVGKRNMIAANEPCKIVESSDEDEDEAKDQTTGETRNSEDVSETLSSEQNGSALESAHADQDSDSVAAALGLS